MPHGMFRWQGHQTSQMGMLQVDTNSELRRKLLSFLFSQPITLRRQDNLSVEHDQLHHCERMRCTKLVHIEHGISTELGDLISLITDSFFLVPKFNK